MTFLGPRLRGDHGERNTMPSTGPAADVKTKLDIVEIVRERIDLKKAGTVWKACCPFHQEKTPSFVVSSSRQTWHCFGCGEGGDVFEFVMRTDGLEFGEALRVLAQKAGVTLKSEDFKRASEKQQLFDANRMAGRFWHEVLLRSPQAEPARAYVYKKRALAETTVEDFLIGYAPESWDATLKFLGKKGFAPDVCARAGLVVPSERGGYDRFRNRLMFPIRDGQGNIVGFTGRVMPGADGVELKEAKYVNTPQTLAYNKSKILFALDRAKDDIRRKKFAVVVEGNMDAIASHQAGVKNVVASSGTALTSDQLDLLKRFCSRIVLSFDADDAGENAARRGIDAAVASGFAVRVLVLPPDAGKDPDDCIRKDPEAWKKAIADAIPFMDWYISRAKAKTDFTDPESKKEAANILLAEAAKLPEPVERSHWVRVFAEMFETPESLLFEKVQKMRNETAPRGRGVEESRGRVAERPKLAQARPAVMGRLRLVSEHVLGLTFAWPEDFADSAIAAIMPEQLDDALAPLYTRFVVEYSGRRSGGASSGATGVTPVEGDEAKETAILAMLAEKEYGDLPVDERRKALLTLIGELKHLHISRRQKELTAELTRAEKSGDVAVAETIQRQLSALMQ